IAMCSYPIARNAFAGNRSSGHLVSCRHRTSGWWVRRKVSTSGMRRRTELMFQAAIEKGIGIPGRADGQEREPASRRAVMQEFGRVMLARCRYSTGMTSRRPDSRRMRAPAPFPTARPQSGLSPLRRLRFLDFLIVDREHRGVERDTLLHIEDHHRGVLALRVG